MKRLILGILVAIGLVSVSFGAYIPKSYEENYQKLKAEMEEVEQSGNWDRIGATCSWGENGKVVVIKNSNLSHLYGTKGEEWCHLKNVLAFVDEYRKFDKKELEKELKKFNKNARVWGSDVYRKVEQMPRFKEDSGIYGWKSIERLLENALEKWEILKMELEISKYMN